MTLATLALAASLAFAQTTKPDSATTPGDMPNIAPSTTDAPATDGAAMGTIDNVPPGSTMSNQEGTATPATSANTANRTSPDGYVESRRDNGIVPTLMWLVPLLVAVALLFPLARRWSQRRNTDLSVRPRV